MSQASHSRYSQPLYKDIKHSATSEDLSQRWQPIWSTIPSHVVSLEDYEAAARQYLPITIQALLFENNLAAVDNNAVALDSRQWLPQVLNSLMPDLSCRLLNRNSAVPCDLSLPHPLWFCPVAHHGLYHPHAELATLEAANFMHTPCIFSCMGNTDFAELLPKSEVVAAVQWYWQPLPEKQSSHINNEDNANSKQNNIARREFNLQQILDLVALGMKLLVITVDAPHTGVRAVSRRVNAQLPAHCQTINLPTQANHLSGSSLAMLLAQSPSWEDIAWLVRRCPVPVLLKGILHPKDAKRAQEIGCAGIIVSNHGRRVLADSCAVADILPTLRQHLGDEMIIIADGGVRSGSDIAKLIALGADSVGIGRGYIYGLAMAGALGVAHVNKLLLEELQVTMALLGVSKLPALRDDSLLLGH